MNDDVNAAVEFDEEVFAVMRSEPLTLLCTSSGTGIATVHGDDRNDRERTARWLADRLNGEDSRTAAAVAAAREEQREACARHIREEFLADLDIDADSACLNAPIDATPLSDRLDELADDVLAWRLESAALRAQMEQAEAERDALFVSHANLAAVLADINEAVGGAVGEEPSLVRAVRVLRTQLVEMEVGLEAEKSAHAAREADLDQVCAERDALRAQVEAAREVCAHDSSTTARDVLLAMDLAANGGKATLVTTTPGYSAKAKMP